MTDDIKLTTRHPAHPEEQAYRRGVHQALYAIQRYCERYGNFKMSLLAASDVAEEFRYSCDNRTWYVNDLIAKVHKRVHSNDNAHD